jgi:hypothetical protein
MTHFDGGGHSNVHRKSGRLIQPNPDWKPLSDHDPIEVAADYGKARAFLIG